MEEQQTYVRRRRKGPETEKTDGEKRSYDYLLIQVMICVILLTLAFGLKWMGGEKFQAVRSSYAYYYESNQYLWELRERLYPLYSKLPGYEKIRDTFDSIRAVFASAQGQGGEDIETEMQLGPVPPPEGCTFSPVKLTAKITKPVEYKRQTSDFGYRINPITHKFGFHKGADLAAPQDTSISAAFGGKVIKKAYQSSYGNYCIIKHSDNLQTLYAHCDKVLVEEGTVVSKGETIALVGSTGDATGPHLHFEVHINGVRVDPMWYLEGLE